LQSLINDDEYDAIQTAAHTHDVWTEFRDWLIEVHGVSKTTARTYATQARRILRELDGEITSRTLFRWINDRPSSHRTPFRSSWRRYRLFMREVYKTRLATFPQGVPLPPDVVQALHEIKEKNIGAGSIATLTTVKDTGPRRAALARINRAVEDGDVQVVLDDKGSLFLIPTTAYNTLVTWGKQGSRMDDPTNFRWLIPANPGSKDPMKTLKITRILKKPPTDTSSPE
jgi:hypothetical protein